MRKCLNQGRGLVSHYAIAAAAFGFTVAAMPASAQDVPVSSGAQQLGPVRVGGEAIKEDSYKAEEASSPKYTQPLVDTPRTLTIVPKAVLEDQGVVTFTDALRNVPGITLGVGEGGAGSGDFINLRGFDASNDITIDGFSDRLQYSRSDLFNVKQLEVAKGPNSAINGAGSAAGNINLVSKAPQLDMFARGTLSGGTNDLRRATADLNIPIEALNGAAFRLNVMGHQQDVARRDEITKERWGIAPSIAFGLNGPTRVTLSYFYQEDDNLIDYGVPFDVDGTEFPIDIANYYGVANADTEQQEVEMVTLKVEHDFSDSLRLTNTARYANVHRYAIWSTPQNRNTVGAPGECAPNPDCTFASAVDAILDGRYDEAIFKTAGPQGIGRDVRQELLANQLALNADFATGGIRHNLVTGFEISREKFERTGISVGGLSGRLVNLYDPNPIFSGPTTLTITPGVADNEATRLGFFAFDTMS